MSGGSRRAPTLTGLTGLTGLVGLVGTIGIVALAAPAAAGAAPSPRGIDRTRPPPRLQLALAPVLGPYYPGESDCRTYRTSASCEDGGSFLGAGATLELRLRAIGPLYAHARALMVANTHKLPYAVYTGLGGGGLGLGLYARLAFIRGEYLVVGTAGSPRYRPPFGAIDGASDVYRPHAGMISGGIRLPFAERWNAELWGGIVLGPRAIRDTPNEVSFPDRFQTSFMFGAGFSFDLLRGTQAPATSR